MSKIIFQQAIFLVALSFLSSCTITKKSVVGKLKRSQKVFYDQKYDYESPVTNYAGSNVASESKKGRFSIYTDTEKGYLILLPLKPEDPKRLYYFPDKKSEESMASLSLMEGKSLIYWTRSPLIQAVTIPFKYRFETDGLPYEITTGFNAGISVGAKYNRVNYRRIYYPNVLTEKKSEEVVNQWSLNPSGFAGLTTIGLKAANTNNDVLTDRTVIGITYGGLFVAGYNKVSLGLGVGFDTPLSKAGKEWVYNTKPWIGFVVGLEFIK